VTGNGCDEKEKKKKRKRENDFRSDENRLLKKGLPDLLIGRRS